MMPSCGRAGLLAPCAVVLDTNAVLDWLVFRDPRVAALATLLEAGQVQWIATRPMQQEFEHVLARPALQAWAADPQAVATAWTRHARLQPAPPRPAPWRCTDPADQMFVDLAAAHGARALLTRDRSLLALARRARAAGLVISPPERWLPLAAAAAG